MARGGPACQSFTIQSQLPLRDIPGGPAAKTSCSARDPESIPGQGTRPHMVQLRAGTANKQNIEKKERGEMDGEEEGRKEMKRKAE